eukprot:COSAG02_NODE_14726_length_1242_cov_13.224847_3_plen_46_part_00
MDFSGADGLLRHYVSADTETGLILKLLTNMNLMFKYIWSCNSDIY